MAAALIGNIMISNIRTNISATSATGIVSGSSQVLASNISANPTLGSSNSNNYTYQWSYTGSAITFTAQNSNSTNCTYGSLSVSGSTTISCTVLDTWTGVKTVTANCVITWPIQSSPQNVVISGTATYDGTVKLYTITGNPASPAPSGTPSGFTAFGTYGYLTGITSITPGSGYTLGTVSGNFVINRAQITAMTFTLNGAAFTTAQSRTAGTSYTIAVSGCTPNGAFTSTSFTPISTTVSTAGSWQLSSSGTGNYFGGPFTSPVLTLTAAVVSGTVDEIDRFTTTQVQLQATLSNATATGYTWSRVVGGGTYTGSVSIAPNSQSTTTVTANAAPTGSTSVIRCIISYSGGTVAPELTVQWGLI